jgi:pimeloyl-ACP methyl ester carboxylesterase
VANLEMPWAGRRDYDVGLEAGVDEVTRALDAMRAKGATRLFMAGHSQGGLFAVLYGGRHKVDGIVAIAPGGQVDVAAFTRALGEHVAKARQMVAEGRGDEKASFGDFEGRRGVTPLRTTAASYLSWFDPSGAHTTRAFSQVKEGTPVLYVAPTGDYPALARARDENFAALPKHAASRLLQVSSDHLGAPSAAKDQVADWIRSVAGN